MIKNDATQQQQHILVDGKVDYELEELGVRLHGDDEANQAGLGTIECWESAKFLLEQGFEVEDHQLEKRRREELLFECEEGVIPKLMIPLSSSRRDLEIILNQLMSIVENDVGCREWIVKSCFQLLERQQHSDFTDIKYLFEYFPNIIQYLFNLNVKVVENSEASSLDVRIEESLIKSVLIILKEHFKEELIIDICFAFIYMKSKEYDKAEIFLSSMVNTSKTQDNGMCGSLVY